MSKIALLNGRPYKKGLPSHDAIRLFREKHRELAFRNYEVKDKGEKKGESFHHVEPFFLVYFLSERYITT